ncbi:hypothetical protein [Streptomyces natalensis]|uniref:Uncharacterized protein n=1 Tax=Streptomyces natalensis ATCC 27448 TaxID=1240678 RepID=A0A0D7CN67_9ACTN|nr:hypothetical protein [Streptomyces natalensis]KIZ16862.1 hypothetical protein SNA_17895 [Streptomyces natalensis ATCC 27448]
MLAKYQARQRHQKLMRVAHHLLGEVADRRRPESLRYHPVTADVTAQDVSAYAFGRYQLNLDLDEAQRYLDAARVSRGETAAPATA